MHRILLFLFMNGLLASSANAQVRARVVDESGHPIVSAAVELWTDSSRLQVLVTDGAGSVVVSPNRLAETRRVIISRLGYRTVVFAPVQFVDGAALVLPAVPLIAPGIEAVAQASPCPRRDDSAARAIWAAAASRYAPVSDSAGFQVQASIRRGYVHAEDVGPRYAASDLTGMTVVWADPRDPTEKRIRTTGYARTKQVREGLGGGPFDDDYDHWEYIPLESRSSYHFASSLFGELHQFELARQDGNTATLRFCTRDSGKPGIDGILEISLSDTSFVHGSWRFTTRRPDERAGGEVTFRPRSIASGHSFLAAARGTYWRYHQNVGMYYQRAVSFTNWSVQQPRR